MAADVPRLQSGVESRLKGFQDEIKVVKDSLKKLLPEREKVR